MTQPAVSICIPTYNYGKYIGEAIESVLSQTFEDFELIIIDDCSVDDTDSVINKYNFLGKSIRYYRNEHNIGMVNNWNLCLREARGQYIKFLFADDKFVDNDAIRIMYESLEANTSAVIATSARLVIDDKSNAINVWSCFKDDSLVKGHEMIKQCLLEQRNIIGEPTAVMFKREIAKRAFDVSYRQLVDLEMWLNLLTYGNLVYTEKTLVAFRQHCTQQSELNSQTDICIHEMYRITKKYVNSCMLPARKCIKKYLTYNYCYKIWKAMRARKIENHVALRIINKSIKIKFFYAFMPFYKIICPLFKFTVKRRRNKISTLKI